MHPALHGLLRKVRITQYQFVRVRAVAAQRMVFHWYGLNALHAHGREHFVRKVDAGESRHQMQPRSLPADSESVAKVPPQTFQEVEPFAFVQLAHFPDMPLKPAT